MTPYPRLRLNASAACALMSEESTVWPQRHEELNLHIVSSAPYGSSPPNTLLAFGVDPVQLPIGQGGHNS